MREGMPTSRAPQVIPQTIEAVRIVPRFQERIDSEEKFKTYKTNELIGELSRGIEKLRPQENGEDGSHLTESEIERINRAVNLAVELHIDQKDRPNGEPYINHVLNVARRLVAEYGVTNQNTIMAAALHDSVEDQSAKLAALNSSTEGNDREKSLKYIAVHFGERVSSIVHSLSNEEVPDDLDAKTKNRMYAEHVAEAVKDPEVALVKLADFSDNALTLEKITDPKRRVKLTEKYMPVVAMFIDRVQGEDIQMSKEQRGNLVMRLKSVYSEMGAYIKSSSPTSAESKEKPKILYTAFLLRISLN